jgi:hypothetical protein
VDDAAGISKIDDVEAVGFDDNIVSSHMRTLLKTLFALSRCRILKAKGSGDLLSRAQMHVGGRDEENYDGGAVVNRDENWDDQDAGCQTPYIGPSPRTDSYP